MGYAFQSYLQLLISHLLQPISYRLGGFLAGKTEIDHYNSERAREVKEVETVPDREEEEIYEIFEPCKWFSLFNQLWNNRANTSKSKMDSQSLLFDP